MDDTKPGSSWVRVIDADKLRARGRAVVKLDGKQLALFVAGERLYACNNRCPHEGYPLVEGHLGDGSAGQCVLTCNWHNWKFELDSGHNVYGGDALRLYPTRLADGAVWVDIADPPQNERIARALERLRPAMADNEYDRIARELARLAKAGADPRDAVAFAIDASHARLRNGMTHAYAASAGWLRLHDSLSDPAEQLTCLAEAVGHIAFDTLRESEWPYGGGQAKWDAAAFEAAVEAQDEDTALALMRGALADGLAFEALEPALAAAALAHYNDFGHSLIYLPACAELIERFGARVSRPLLLSWVRSVVRATREDLIPDFRKYPETLRAWHTTAPPARGPLDPRSFVGLSVNRTLSEALAVRAHAPLDIFHALLGAAAIHLLRYDESHELRPEGTVADNIGWLDFTHSITFAHAARITCTRLPHLWPGALLQMALLVGRNTPYLGGDERTEAGDDDLAAFETVGRARVLNHGVGLYIHSAHLLKTWLAARDEIATAPRPIAALVAGSVNRYLGARVHQKRTLRTARQALEFVTLED